MDFLSILGISFRTESDEDVGLVRWYDKAKAKKEKPVPFDADQLKSHWNRKDIYK